MSDDSQVPVAESFVRLFVEPGRMRTRLPRAQIVERHEFCEDLAQMLAEPALNRRFELGVTEADVLERMHRGLLGDAAAVSAAEAWWVVHRLAELLDWPAPNLAPPG